MVDVDRIKLDLVSCSRDVWGQPTLRPAQLQVAAALVDPRKPNNVIASLRTGYGKSHIARTLGAYLAGFTLVFIPLLSLSADVLEKFQSANQKFGRVRVYHLDELLPDYYPTYKEFINLCYSARRSDADTTYVFLSPQFLVKHSDALRAVLHAANERTLRLVVLDEVHLHVQHGDSFREDVRILADLFFSVVFHPADTESTVLFLALTATLPEQYLASLSRLTTLPFPPQCVIRGSLEDFMQREINLTQICCGKKAYAGAGIDEAIDHLRKNAQSKLVLFTNSKRNSFKFVAALERKLDEAKLPVPVDVLHIHGSLLKMEKFWRVRLFCHKIGDSGDANLRALVGTSAVNVGIDNDAIDMVIRFEFPRDLATVFQECGRGSRRRHSKSTCLVMYDLQSFDYMMRLYLSPIKMSECDSDDKREFRAATMVVSPGGTSRQQSSTGGEAALSKKRFVLSRAAKKRLNDRQVRELQEVSQFYCLNFGCQQIRKEHYLSTGILVLRRHEGTACATSCAICSGAWHTIHRPVYQDSVTSFFQAKIGRDSMPFVSGNDKTVSSILWGEAGWIEKIFDEAAYEVKRSHVDAFFFSLIAAGILFMEPIANGARWLVRYDENDIPCYTKQDAWIGVNTHSPTRPRKRRPKSVSPSAVASMKNSMKSWLGSK